MLKIVLNRDTRTPLTRQVYEQIRTSILNGDLKAGERLPSSRDLATNLNVARIVIVEAYELLIAEGFLAGCTGSGTYVAPGAFLERAFVPTPIPPEIIVPELTKKEANFIDFRSGVPALDLFPRKKWADLTQRSYMEAPESLLSYGPPEGYSELREVIADYLKRTRGVICHHEQLLITSGSVQGLVLVAQTLLTPSASVIIEDPANRDIRKIFAAAGGEILPVTVDEQGIQTDLILQIPNPVLIQITPSHQFPLGGNLPIQRRIELVQYARVKNCYIIEDDYDSEFRYEGPPISSLQGLAPEKVIYLGTFSKVLFPSLRLGYMVLPVVLVEKFRACKRRSDIHTNSLNQLILTRFIREGYFERHLAKMKKLYRKRRDTLIQALFANFPDQMSISGQTTGLHLIANFKSIEFNETILKQVHERAIGVYPVAIHSLFKGAHSRELILGYGHLQEEQLWEGVRKLKEALRI